MRRAVVDVGSNSVLLTIAERGESAWKPLLETSTVTALGEGTRETGLLSQRSTTATLNALAEAFSNAKTRHAEVRAYGTMALRIAGNAQTFLDSAAAQGTPVTVISGETEAELGLASVADDPAFSAHKRIAVVDVGGHSTEVAVHERGGSAFRASFPVGTLGMRSQYLREESPPAGAILQASAALDDAFDNLEAAGCPVIGLGAGVTNLASIRAQLAEWNPDAIHGVFLDYEEVSRFVGRSMRMTDAERADLIGIEPGRERTVHIGALIVERALLALRAEGIFVSVCGWRHAMLDRWL